jgi:annexin A7/11
VREVTQHTNEQLTKINLEYQKKYDKNLYQAIKDDTSGDYCDLLVSLVMPINDYRAFAIKEAIAGAGTDEDALIDIFAHASIQEITDFRKSYEFVTNKNLEKEIADDLSGNFKKGILSLLHLFRESGSDPSKALHDAEEIYKKGEGKWGTDDDFFVKFFTTKSFEHIAIVDAAYTQKYGHSLKVAIDKETSGHYCQLLKALVTPRYHYYAKRIHDAIAGLGTKDKLLQRILVLNNSYEHLNHLKRVYQELYKESLIDAIKGDTSGWYKETFVGILDRPF